MMLWRMTDWSEFMGLMSSTGSPSPSTGMRRRSSSVGSAKEYVMVSLRPDAVMVRLTVSSTCSIWERTPKRPRPPGSVSGMRSMPYRRSTSSYRSISRGRSGRNVGETTSSTSSSAVSSTLQPKRSRISTMNSRGIWAPIMERKRGMRNFSCAAVLGSGHTSTMPWSSAAAALTVPPATSTMRAAAAAERASTPWSSTPRS